MVCRETMNLSGLNPLYKDHHFVISLNTSISLWNTTMDKDRRVIKSKKAQEKKKKKAKIQQDSESKKKPQKMKASTSTPVSITPHERISRILRELF